MNARGEEEQVQRIHSALASVQADTTATLPEWSGLQIRVAPEDGDGEEDVVTYVAD